MREITLRPQECIAAQFVIARLGETWHCVTEKKSDKPFAKLSGEGDTPMAALMSALEKSGGGNGT